MREGVVSPEDFGEFVEVRGSGIFWKQGDRLRNEYRGDVLSWEPSESEDGQFTPRVGSDSCGVLTYDGKEQRNVYGRIESGVPAMTFGALAKGGSVEYGTASPSHFGYGACLSTIRLLEEAGGSLSLAEKEGLCIVEIAVPTEDGTEKVVFELDIGMKLYPVRMATYGPQLNGHVLLQFEMKAEEVAVTDSQMPCLRRGKVCFYDTTTGTSMLFKETTMTISEYVSGKEYEQELFHQEFPVGLPITNEVAGLSYVVGGPGKQNCGVSQRYETTPLND